MLRAIFLVRSARRETWEQHLSCPMPYADTEAMQKHLEEISRNVSPKAHAVILLDGAGWNKSGNLNIPENISLMFIPPYSPELNPVENIWQFLRQTYLSNQIFNDYE